MIRNGGGNEGKFLEEEYMGRFGVGRSLTTKICSVRLIHTVVYKNIIHVVKG